MTYRRKRRGVPRFLQLHHRLLKSHAWHALTTLERSGYTELAQLFDGTNNGREPGGRWFHRGGQAR